MAENQEILSCVTIPVADRQLLLPNVSIAEIVDYAEPEAADGPEWLHGYLQWRGLRLPVVSYEAANGAGSVPPPAGRRGRIAVLNTISEYHDRLPFLALVTQGIPRQAKVEASQLQVRDGAETGPADIMVVNFEGEELTIPSLEYLEKLAAEAAA
ncbi:chemotaxis protein CheW [Marinobacteraceae bacterium S3BR75-40.1]